MKNRFAYLETPAVENITVTTDHENKVFVMNGDAPVELGVYPVTPRPVICLEGFTDPLTTAEFMQGIDADFINPHAEIITVETQQMEDDLKKRLFQSVFLFTPTKPGIFALGEAVVNSLKQPEKTIFIIEEKDMEHLKNESNEAKHIVNLIKDQNLSVFSNLSEAKKDILQQIDGNLVKAPESEVVDVDTLQDTV